MGKTIVLVHGRSSKPTRRALRGLWVDALRFGLERDHPKKVLSFKKARVAFVYYGDINNAFLVPGGHDVVTDAATRRKTLRELKRLGKADFNKARYNRLPGKTAMREFLADALGGVLSALAISDRLIELIAPDMREYWNPGSEFGSRVRHPMIRPLKLAMNRDDKILVIAHSLGSIIAYDTFWKFSRMGEYRPRYTSKKIDLFISIGSPLGDETVKKHLKGAYSRGELRYPSNIVRWVNIAAEDDFIAHDERVANDFKDMVKYGLVRSIEDRRVHNLAVRNGKSNPHHGVGYLIHPVMAEIVADWL